MSVDWTLQPQQSLAFNTPATELLYGGAAFGGKSHLMRIAAILWCMWIPGLQVYLFRRISDDLSKNHMEGPSSFPALLAGLVRLKSVTITYNPITIRFKNGACIFLCHCQYEKDRFKYQGSEIHVLMIDELTTFTRTIYTFLRSRVRMVGITLPEQYKRMFPRIICGSNPGNIGHNWVKAMFIEPKRPMEIWQTEKHDGGLLRQYIPARMEDNRIGMEADPTYEDRLEGLNDAALVRAMKKGDWDIVAGGAFDDLWDLETHVIPPFRIPASWIVDRSFDDGDSKPFSVGWWAVSDGTEVMTNHRGLWAPPKGTLFRIHEWYGWNGHPNEGSRMVPVAIAAGIKEIETGLMDRNYGLVMSSQIFPGPADNAIFDAERGSSVADQMKPEKIYWKRCDKKPGSRVAGVRKMRELLRNSLLATQGKRDDLPGFYVFDTCRHFIRTIPTLPRDANKVDDVDTDAEDHVWDDTRYRVLKPAATPQAIQMVGV